MATDMQGSDICSERVCIACSSNDVFFIKIRPELEYQSCRACGHCTQVMRHDTHLNFFEIAQEKYYGNASHSFSTQLTVFEREVLACRATVINNFLKTPSKVLEIGPGGGHVLNWLLSRKHKVTAIEHSSSLAHQLAKYQCDQIVVGEFESLEIRPNEFDAICSFHVIEHVRDPMLHLSRALSVVRPGGYAFVATPNAWSWQQLLFPKLSPNFDSAHLYVFSSASLRRMCEEAGWIVLRDDTPEFSMGWLRVLSKGLRRLRNEDEEDTAGKYSQTSSSLIKFIFTIARIGTSPVRFLQHILKRGNEVFFVLQKPA